MLSMLKVFNLEKCSQWPNCSPKKNLAPASEPITRSGHSLRPLAPVRATVAQSHAPATVARSRTPYPVACCPVAEQSGTLPTIRLLNILLFRGLKVSNY